MYFLKHLPHDYYCNIAILYCDNIIISSACNYAIIGGIYIYDVIYYNQITRWPWLLVHGIFDMAINRGSVCKKCSQLLLRIFVFFIYGYSST